MRPLFTSRLIWVYTVCKGLCFGLQGLKFNRNETDKQTTFLYTANRTSLRLAHTYKRSYPEKATGMKHTVSKTSKEEYRQ